MKSQKSEIRNQKSSLLTPHYSLLPGLVLLALLPVLAFSFQATGGGCGLFRVQDAKSEGAGWLTITDHTYMRELHSQYMADIMGSVALAPFPWMELMVEPGYALAGDTSGLNSFKHTQTDTRFGAKLELPIIPVLKLGVAGFDQLANRDMTMHFEDYPFLTGRYLGGMGIVALDLKDELSFLPFNIVGNYGYFKHTNPDTVYNSIGIGLDLASRSLEAFIEGYSEFAKGDRPFSSTSETHITPGVRFGSGFGLDLGLDFGLTGAAAKTTFIAGLHFGSQLYRPAPKPVGSVAGTIADYQSGAPLSATLILPNTKVRMYNKKTITVRDDGAFKLDKLPVGSVVIEVYKDAYQKATATVVVENGKTTVYDFKLHTLKQYGTITGRVTDARTGNPLAATIKFPGTKLADIQTDSQTGVFTLKDVDVGVVSVEADVNGYPSNSASGSGYRSETEPVVVEDGKTATVEFQLRLATEVGSLSGTVTDASTNKPVKAEISFADSTLAKVMTDESTGFYKADNVPVGVNVVKVTADSYFTAQATVTIAANSAVTQNFALNPAVQNGQLTGMVTDKTSKNPLKATVYFPNSQVAPVMSDSGTGFFKAQVPAGATVVACSLPGYAKQLSQTPVIVKQGEPTVYNFEMLKIGTEIVLQASAIHFAFNSAEIQPEGYPALDGWVKLMKDNPFMTAEIQGHADAVGSESYNLDLSNRRATAVVDYLVSKGVERARLTPVGYGKSQLIEQTDGPSETNRRVVFKVTGEINKQ